MQNQTFASQGLFPLALQEDLNAAYDAGIKRGIWKPVTVNKWGTPVVPIRKVALPGRKAAQSLW